MAPLTAHTQAHSEAMSKRRWPKENAETDRNWYRDRWTSLRLRTCSTMPLRILPEMSFCRRNQRSTFKGLLVTQNNPASSNTMSTREVSRALSAMEALKSMTPESPMSTSQMVDTAEDTTKNQAHNATVAPQERCTRQVNSAEKAGPTGSVVEHAFDAKDTAVASFSDTETSPAMMSCCITPLIATNDATEAIMTTVTATGLAFWSR